MGINNAGDIVGLYFGSIGPSHAFAKLNGVIGPFNVPADPSAKLTAINNKGELAGTMSGPSGFQGFVDENSVFSTVFVPGSFGTQVTGLNDLGQVVGFYFDSTGGTHAFEATPVPEPASLLLSLSACLAFCVHRAVRRRFIDPARAQPGTDRL